MHLDQLLSHRLDGRRSYAIPRPWSSQHDAHGTSSSAPEYLAFHLLSRLAFNLCFFHSLLESTADARDADGPNADADATRNATGNAARDADGSNANANANANADAARNAAWDAARDADGFNANANADANADAARNAAWDAARDADGPNANADADANAARNATGNADGSNADANANANAARDATRYAGIWSHRRASTYRTAEIW